MKKLLLASLFVLSSVSGYAQGVTATATWQQPGADVPTAQSYTYTLKIDTATPINLTQTCSTVNSQTQCTAPVANYIVGVHTVVLTASNANGSASQTVTTGAPPSNPTSTKIIVIIVGDDNNGQ